MNQVFVCGTYFHIYVSILKYLSRPDQQSESLLVLNDHTPGIENIIPALKANGFFDHHLAVPFRKIERESRKNNNLLNRILFRNTMLIREVESHSEINQHNTLIEKSEFNFFYLWGYPSAYFVLRYPNNFARVLEDGARNYLVRTSYLKYLKRKYLLNTYIGDGIDNMIQEIQVQHPENLDSRVRKKGVKLDLKKLQADLSPEQNQRILNVFMKDPLPEAETGKKLLIITQPLSEDNYITEERKVALYEHLIEMHGKNHRVYLKAHPRELTNYCEKLKSKFIEIPRAFPLEMLDLMQTLHFDKGVTIFSSSIGNLNCITEKVHLGLEYIKDLSVDKKWLTSHKN